MVLLEPEVYASHWPTYTPVKTQIKTEEEGLEFSLGFRLKSTKKGNVIP